MDILKKIIHDPMLYLIWLIGRLMPKNITFDKVFLKLLYKHKMRKKLNIDNPQTFNEKLQWLKLYDRNPKYTKMVDKYEAKEYVASIIGEEYIIPTLGVWENFDEINFDELPDQFVLKCTHDSGGLVIVTDKNSFNKDEARKKINHCLKRNYYTNTREWPYKNIKPRIIAEKYMVDESGYELKDYKFFCFDGICKIMYVSSNSHKKNQQIAFFDMNYNSIPIERYDYNDFKKLPVKPKNFEKMKELVVRLSQNIKHVRLDFYEVNGKPYFGEFTFYTGSGFIPFKSESWDYMLGEWISLSKRGE